MAVKLALDPQMFFSSSSVYELPDIVASIGYDWMELSPKADFVPFFKYPRIDDAGVKRLKKLASDAGVGIASVLPVLRWSGPDEDQRSAAVRAWKRVIQITVDLGVDVINSEFNGRPEAPETAEAQFLKSMDELLPIFEREGVQLIIEPHPDDFIEDGLEGAEHDSRLEQGLDRFPLLHSACFHQGHDPATIIEAAGDKVR
jgi:myo-inositol catabolism protein IolH